MTIYCSERKKSNLTCLCFAFLFVRRRAASSRLNDDHFIHHRNTHTHTSLHSVLIEIWLIVIQLPAFFFTGTDGERASVNHDWKNSGGERKASEQILNGNSIEYFKHGNWFFPFIGIFIWQQTRPTLDERNRGNRKREIEEWVSEVSASHFDLVKFRCNHAKPQISCCCCFSSRLLFTKIDEFF